ncbi:cystathionine gamma-synthase [Propionicimonas sp.]|uniref:cystathionine gamma-synthase n=1 Tax=Propionicimonas sp. TaxID=1955623 RepID=UPI001815884A|nr:cystathionine gamma-synthase [Propionicimonas sp.]MBU3975382.1 cystathionine gamma-synthase [Actinomycetota bacterium]MBA3020212.1 cystathionine gamma-synthase [Propionicimonas sp.]MBU3986469.1 cystathionine gamma-synthase [Actinomycetota bacterium]MBU4008038.1 cystathionine gamma-synthase [Actinomycetota bacterium]MBU4064296.1 cystathionine gamma-synthase [Actinomycetota bacterium]
MNTPSKPENDPSALRPHPQTAVVRAGIETDTAHGAVTPPIYLATSYAFASLDRRGAYDYSRSGNPTRELFGQAVAELEGGLASCVTASGMAAISTTVLALVPDGGTLIAPVDCYGGSWRLFDALAKAGRLKLKLIDFSNLDAARAAITTGVDLVWLETPSNPLLRITDIAAVAAVAHAAGALVVADNTFASPVVQRPLALGVDVVVHSATKYLNGHSDVVAGVIVAADAELGGQLCWWANTLGTTGGAFDSYLALRGLRTLHLRLAAAQRGAAAVVELLVDHPAVRAVYYPGLATHPQHELAKRQSDGFGAIVTFELADQAAVAALLAGLNYFCLAESLGGVESLISHPASMTHAAMPDHVQTAAGISPGMLRLSIGIEEPTDLVADLRAGLGRALLAREL